jgi:uncharacterized protein (TIGR02301 family)
VRLTLLSKAAFLPLAAARLRPQIGGMRKLAKFCAALGASMLLSAPVSLAAEPGDPPYQPKLERLSEILGSVHYLSNLCGKKTSVWRDKMDELLTAEKPADERKTRLVARFNRGYRSFASVYENCTGSASLALKNYAREGEGLTKEIVLRYGN